MSWRNKAITRILLIIARMLVEDPKSELNDELQSLSAHLSYAEPKASD
jgi:hypothetical protein